MMVKCMKKRVSNIKRFLMEHKWILLIVLALFLERFYAGYTLGITYNIKSDDMSYVQSGIEFANTGRITMHGVLSAQIMPGMPVLLGGLSLVFGEGRMLWFAMKILWWFMGSLSAFFVYKIVTMFLPKGFGLASTLGFFAVDFVWMDNVILTETPFMLCFCIMIYATLMMANNKNYFWPCAIFYILALMFKANIAIYPLFAMCYLFLKKYDLKIFAKQCVILASMVLCFVIPWSIRNYIHYDEFIPLTWGSGNPMLLGTYQGHGYPLDENLDYVTNVDEVAEEKYQKYYNDNGELKEDYLAKYISLETDGIKAKYRLKEWAKSDLLSLLDSYLIVKPVSMFDDVFYWDTLWNIDSLEILKLHKLDVWLCVFVIFLSFYLKKYRKEIGFLTFLYVGNIYVYAMTFAFSRYAATLMPIRFIIVEIGYYLIICFLRKLLEVVGREEIIE